ncbi:murein L,D-transpeptidase family protein [Methylocapsa sp. S129]|uniref:L,D-transpeptidase family protein n=1 Tax=Methylocapsa sp. S129 TaxID=1641869 RepID=UPI00131C7103|nr:murein L,D-transpeptidase family protein [Methylocapsa sp. S129]
MTRSFWGSRLAAFALAASLAAMLAGCDGDQLAGGSGRSLSPIPPQTIALMQQMDTATSSPVLIRTYKKEAEFEIWKMKTDGRYALLKTYPMCRWSGQLGPKTREGDRQVPEGFYPITPGQMNPNSNYYLSFNVGYPNAYDRAFGRTGGTIMVHGACSSAGCFSMTDAQIAEIYAIARDAFNGGQREIQMQSYPFHMTAENLAKHRLDPNIDFWKQLKNGSDHFEVTKAEPQVGVCAKRYVFGAPNVGDSNPTGTCPALHRDEQVEADVAAKQARDDAAVAQLVAQGVKPIELVYDDGGQNPSFIGQKGDVSRPDAITASPTEVVLDDKTGQPVPTVVKVAEATQAQHVGAAPVVASAPAQTMVAQAPASSDATPAGSPLSPVGLVGGATDASQSFVKKWLSFGGDAADASSAVKVYEPAQPVPSDVPLPPRRNAANDSASKPQASLKVQSFAARPTQLKPAPGTLALAAAPSQ